MGFNPKNTGKPVKATHLPEVGGKGPGGVILSRLAIIKSQAKSDLNYKNVGLKTPPPSSNSRWPKVKYNIVWQKLGDPLNTLLNGTASVRNLKHLIDKIQAAGTRKVVFVQRAFDKAVLVDRRGGCSNDNSRCVGK